MDSSDRIPYWRSCRRASSKSRPLQLASCPRAELTCPFETSSGVVVIDNMANSNMEVLHRVRILAAKYHKERGLAPASHPPLYFHPCDIQDRLGLASLFALYALTPTTSRIASAIHFAALKSVSGSLSDPIGYYQINVGGTLNLVEVLARWNAKKLVFSSSCVVYGSECDGEGITEEMCDVQAGASKGITNPCELRGAWLSVIGTDARSYAQTDGRRGCAKRCWQTCEPLAAHSLATRR